jgi:glycine cleavage system aminomethyltransferase T
MAKSSPLEGVHKALGANFAEYDGWWLPADYGDGPAEAEALAEGCAILAGGSEKCCEGKWIWAGLREGGDMLRVARLGAGFTVFTLPAQAETVLRLAQASADEVNLGDVKIADITNKSAMLGVYGPQAARIADSILPFDIAGIAVGGIEKIALFMISATIIRGSWTGADGVELLGLASVAQMAAGVVAKYRDRANITPAGMDCLQRAIAPGRVNYSTGPNRGQTRQ